MTTHDAILEIREVPRNLGHEGVLRIRRDTSQLDASGLQIDHEEHAHWGQVAATDFFTTEVWTPLGLKTY